MKEIDLLIKELYRSISFKQDNLPDFEKLRDLVFDKGKFVNNNLLEPIIMTVDEYILKFNEQIENGFILEFQEEELSFKIDIFGKIAQRFSTYKTKYKTREREDYSTGINSIQLINIKNRWYIFSIIWNDEKDDLIIPDKYK